MQYRDQTKAAPATEAIVAGEGRYLYCVADAGERVNLGAIGLEGNVVYTIPSKDICAVVHNCPAEPYQSDDQEVVTAWVMTHQKVVDAAWQRWGTVLPLTFDTIIKGDATERKVQDWLEQEYKGLKRKIERVRDRAEYGVQVLWDPKVIAQKLTQTSPEIKKLEQEIETKSKGLAYMYRQRLENIIKREMETKADECFRDFYSRIRKHADDIRVEKTKGAEQDLQMIMNLSCLVRRDKYTGLGGGAGQDQSAGGLFGAFYGTLASL
ncbi:MAG: GvpL/GvpF family gas vesicle protein [Chloroflexi bacterium]|nr:GvpL/GvpF family gas vesicle protein [Chloroflexota bacterium]